MSTTQQDIDNDEKLAKLKAELHPLELSVRLAITDYWEAGASETWLAESIIGSLPREKVKILVEEIKYFLND